ncbi:MAG: alpha/beta hydrolase, partial [Acidimicrobiales bacterium]
MRDVSFVTVKNGSTHLNVAVQGDGPLIVCVHGWPELWYSWRHQMSYFSARGFTVAALDVRGYGGSSKPEEVSAYTLTELTSDVASVIDALGGGEAIVFGHDWGAPIAWNTARLFPTKVRAVAGLSVPYTPVGPQSSLLLWQALYPDKFFYQNYFVVEGVAEAELGADTADSVRKIYHSLSGAAAGVFSADKPVDAGLLDGVEAPTSFPSWLTEADLAVYSGALESGGWRGPLNRYRAQDLDAEQLGSRPEAELPQPACFIAGEHDPVRHFVPGVDLFDVASGSCRDFRGTTIIP